MILQGRLETEECIENSINSKLNELPNYVSNWYYSLRAQDVSIKSCRDYLSKIHYFLCFLNNNLMDINLADITDSDLSKFFIKIQTKTLKDGSITKTSESYRKTMWFALNNFFEYQLTVGNINKNYMGIVKKKKSKNDDNAIKRNNNLLTANDFKKMLCFIPGENLNIRKRNKAILLLYMTTGMRRDALRQINVSDIDFETNELVVIDKGEKTHNYNLNKETLDAINEWLKVRKFLLSYKMTDALFLTYQGNRISGNAIYNMITETTEIALGRKLSPHKLRAGLCSILYEETHDIEFVRRAIGHSNIATTTRYIHTNENEKKKASDIMEKLLV